MKKSKRNPFVSKLCEEIANYPDANLLDPEDYQDLLREQELPDGFMTEFREQCRKEWEEHYFPHAGNWTYFEDLFKLFLGEELYNKI